MKSVTTADEAIEKAKNEKLQSVFNLMDAASIFEKLPPPFYLVPQLRMGPGRPSMIAGYGAAGKTIATQSLALSVATGRDVWTSKDGAQTIGKPVTTKVLHLDRDQGSVRARRQYQRLASGMGIKKEELQGRLYLSPFPSLTFANDSMAWAEQLEELVLLHKDGDHGPLVIFDAFVGFLGELEENSTEAAKPLYKLGEISERTGATFLMLHHARKGSGKEEKANSKDTKLSIRGSSAIFGAIDVALILEADKALGSGVCKVTHEKSPSIKLGDIHLKISSPPDDDNGPLHCGMTRVDAAKSPPRRKDSNAKEFGGALMDAIPLPSNQKKYDLGE